MKSIIFCLLMVFAINSLIGQTSCYPGRFEQTPLFDSSDIRKDSNIVFANSVNYFSGAMQNLKMDVYYANPAVDTMQGRPFILLIHGGAFLLGSRQDMAYQCMEYARRGFVVGTIDYRLGWNCSAMDLLGVCVLCQAQNFNLKTATYCAAQDARAALRFIKANDTTWGANANWLFIGGESAGAITSYHAAFWDQAEANSFASWAVAAVGTLDTAGNSLPNTWAVNAVIDNCGAISKDSALMNNGNIPVISFHDQLDCVVPYGSGQVISCLCSAFYFVKGSQVINARLNSMGVCTELNTVPNSLNHCSYPINNVIRRSSCFLKRAMCYNCVSAVNTNIWAVNNCDNLPAGVSEFGVLPPTIDVYPNPVSELCSVRFSEPTRNSGTINIYNMAGKLVGTQNYPPLTKEVLISLQGFVEGVYYLTTTITQGILGTRFSIIR